MYVVLRSKTGISDLRNLMDSLQDWIPDMILGRTYTWGKPACNIKWLQVSKPHRINILNFPQGKAADVKLTLQICEAYI